MLDLAIHSFVTLFVTADPIGLAPIFIAIAGGTASPTSAPSRFAPCSSPASSSSPSRSSATALLAFFGITVPAFQIAGGLLLFVIAFEMVFSSGDAKREGPSAAASGGRPDADRGVSLSRSR